MNEYEMKYYVRMNILRKYYFEIACIYEKELNVSSKVSKIMVLINVYVRLQFSGVYIFTFCGFLKQIIVFITMHKSKKAQLIEEKSLPLFLMGLTNFLSSQNKKSNSMTRPDSVNENNKYSHVYNKHHTAYKVCLQY